MMYSREAVLGVLALAFALFVVKVAIPFTRGYIAGARAEWRRIRDHLGEGR